MSIAKMLLASSLLLSLVSCGNDSDKKSSNRQAQDSVVQSYDYKIFNNRGFPEKAYVELNGEPVLDECHDKQIFAINRATTPHTLFVTNRSDAPTGETVNVKVFDRGVNCDQTTPVSDDTVEFQLNKAGVVGEVIVNI